MNKRKYKTPGRPRKGPARLDNMPIELWVLEGFKTLSMRTGRPYKDVIRDSLRQTLIANDINEEEGDVF